MSLLPFANAFTREEDTEEERHLRNQLARFKPVELIGAGSFGSVYKGRDSSFQKRTPEKHWVAIKVEKRNKRGDKPSALLREYETYRTLIDRAVGMDFGLPHIIQFIDNVPQRTHIMVMELLGPDLRCLLIDCGGTFSLKTVLQIGVQLIDRMELVHDLGFLHRDIKPHNFAIGSEFQRRDLRNMIRVIDFGFAKEIMTKEEQHIAFSRHEFFVGTMKYSSIRSQEGLTTSRRDDLEAITYLLISFIRGKLPWSDVIQGKYNPEHKRYYFKETLRIKKEISIKELCGEDIPRALEYMLRYTRNGLSFTDRPDYEYLRSQLIKCFYDNEFPNDNLYDWDLLGTDGNEGPRRQTGRERPRLCSYL